MCDLELHSFHVSARCWHGDFLASPDSRPEMKNTWHVAEPSAHMLARRPIHSYDQIGLSFPSCTAAIYQVSGFSATLRPQSYFKTLMGLNDDSLWYQIPSPFNEENLGVFTTSFLSTTYHNRTASLYDLVDTLALVVEARVGNYLAFFPSHAYLQMVAEKF